MLRAPVEARHALLQRRGDGGASEMGSRRFSETGRRAAGEILLERCSPAPGRCENGHNILRAERGVDGGANIRGGGLLATRIVSASISAATARGMCGAP